MDYIFWSRYDYESLYINKKERKKNRNIRLFSGENFHLRENQNLQIENKRLNKFLNLLSRFY